MTLLMFELTELLGVDGLVEWPGERAVLLMEHLFQHVLTIHQGTCQTLLGQRAVVEQCWSVNKVGT